MPKIYLLGGLGNNLFQIDHGLRQGGEQNVVFVTTLITKRFYSRIFGWTFHEPNLLDLKLSGEIQLVERSAVFVFFDLFLLFFVKRLKTEIFGVTWDSRELTRINFGYYQDLKDKYPFILTVPTNTKIYDAVIHLRLGDSPTLREDLELQLCELDNARFNCIKVVTNDRKHAELLLREYSFQYEFIGGDVLEDLDIMMSTKLLIAPRSTFSLAAALMSVNLETLIIDEVFWLSKGRPVNYRVKFYG